MALKSIFFLIFLLSPPLFADAPKSIPRIDCSSKFPANASYINQMQFIRKWAAYATRISFVINHDTTNETFELHKNCFTPDGWREYTQALHQSGNIDAIKKNQFQTNMMLNGRISVKTDKKNSKWTLHVPIDLVYQNSQTRIRQNLDVFMLVTIKTNGSLAIMQIIGRPVSLP